MKTKVVFDIEIYANYFLVSFMNVETRSIKRFEKYDGCELDIPTLSRIVKECQLISFNGNNFDLPLLTLALEGAGVSKIKQTSDKIINNNLKPWKLGIDIVKCDHIDLIEVSPGMVGLKTYGGRLHCKTIQDLPIEPSALITPDQHQLLRDYCDNDLNVTRALYLKLLPQIQLREEMSKTYGMDLRSKSDAQIAETVIVNSVEKLKGKKLPKRDASELAGEKFTYKKPDFIEFETKQMQDVLAKVLASEFTISGAGVVLMPKELAELKIQLGDSLYQMGIGGLHSTEQSKTHIADDKTLLIDRDVASYYPRIILNCGLAPASMGEHFTKTYNGLVEARLKAKREGDKITADSLKISINGGFGKFGSPYSALYSPLLLIQTTVTGQLALLMLIESLELNTIPVVSANTDGIVIKCPVELHSLLEYIVWEWEAKTEFETEETRYKALYSRDVNNYIAIKEDGGYKTKGVYAPAGLSKNPTNEICIDAILAYLIDDVPIADTIMQCKRIEKFVTIRQVKGGAVKNGDYLGKTVRWYFAEGESGAIQYKVNGYQVAGSIGGKPIMTFPDTFPDDVNYQKYINDTNDILRELGV